MGIIQAKDKISESKRDSAWFTFLLLIGLGIVIAPWLSMMFWLQDGGVIKPFKLVYASIVGLVICGYALREMGKSASIRESQQRKLESNKKIHSNASDRRRS